MLKQRLKNLKHFLIAFCAYWYYGRPARKLIVVGVTGTKGKSTTSRFIASALQAGGHKVGLLSTVEFQVDQKRWLNDKKMTMLGLGQIQKMLREMVVAGCQYAVVETSSEGILQYRHFGLNYDIGVFTNLGTEHSERHGGFENLQADKGKLFAQLAQYPHKIFNGKKVEKIIVANLDDTNAIFYLNYKADKKIGFGIKNRNSNLSQNFFADILSSSVSGVNFQVKEQNYHINLAGEFNVYNALAAIAVAASQSIPAEKISHGLDSVKMVEGRMEFIEAGQKFKVIVDYAHEPMSLTELFTNLKKMVSGKVIAVIGSDGGGRDISKRTKMGEIAGRLCDYVVVSDVNCYDEDSLEIAEMLAAGARQAQKKDNENLFVIVDRRQGIEKAISLATENDVVVITAKGTEPYIAIANGEKIPWDDRAVAREILQKVV
ncbi:MAG: UDP-N-acetylmuramyl-tripeptide synthetase [Candidatus Magasanikbacteria bacterium]|nr:UDP-N-acetylmuramyl-tripeptide synthetase [Candidatus Magasanikbacteria bacterium]